MIQSVAAALAGLIFGIGIMLSGMANPAKILNFFDVTGTFDPSLALVMLGAVVATAIGYRVVLARTRPFFDTTFHLPTTTAIDRKLVLGSVIFGIGWGISGFCPGGAVPALGLGRSEPAVFLTAMIAGMALTRAVLAQMAPASQPRKTLAAAPAQRAKA